MVETCSRCNAIISQKQASQSLSFEAAKLCKRCIKEKFTVSSVAANKDFSRPVTHEFHFKPNQPVTTPQNTLKEDLPYVSKLDLEKEIPFETLEIKPIELNPGIKDIIIGVVLITLPFFPFTTIAGIFYIVKGSLTYKKNRKEKESQT